MIATSITAVKLRKKIVGEGVKLGAVRRAGWAAMVGWWQARLPWGVMSAEADRFGAELRGAEARYWQASDETVDFEIQQAYGRRLRATLETHGKRGRNRSAAEIAADALADDAAQTALDGACPFCGSRLPCEGCEVPVVELDPRTMGLREKTPKVP